MSREGDAQRDATEAPFGCKTCGSDPTHLVEDEHNPTLYCAKCKPAVSGQLDREVATVLQGQAAAGDAHAGDVLNDLIEQRGAAALCPSCRPLATDHNHPPGMIFVGWGHGWQPCQNCGGSGLERDCRRD